MGKNSDGVVDKYLIEKLRPIRACATSIMWCLGILTTRKAKISGCTQALAAAARVQILPVENSRLLVNQTGDQAVLSSLPCCKPCTCIRELVVAEIQTVI